MKQHRTIGLSTCLDWMTSIAIFILCMYGRWCSSALYIEFVESASLTFPQPSSICRVSKSFSCWSGTLSSHNSCVYLDKKTPHPILLRLWWFFSLSDNGMSIISCGVLTFMRHKVPRQLCECFWRWRRRAVRESFFFYVNSLLKTSDKHGCVNKIRTFFYFLKFRERKF